MGYEDQSLSGTETNFQSAAIGENKMVKIKPIIKDLPHGKMIIHNADVRLYKSVLSVCGLEKSNPGTGVRLTPSQIDQLVSLSSLSPLFSKTYLYKSKVGYNDGLSAGVVATLTADSSSLNWLMLHIGRRGPAETDDSWGNKKGDDVIKEDVVALSCTNQGDINSQIIQRVHSDYCGRYVNICDFKKNQLPEGVSFDYSACLSNALCCDIVTPYYNGAQDILTSI
jgi:hypothetical protein